MKSLAGVTVVTPDLDAAVAAYGQYLGYRGPAATRISADTAVRWGHLAATGLRAATLYPESGEPYFIRLIESAPSAAYKSLTHLGWAAAEFIVQDLDRLAARLSRSPFTIIGEPAVLEFDFTDKIRAMQVVGPGGEVLYLTEVTGEIPGFDLPAAKSFVGRLFIAVLAGASLEAAAAPFVALGRARSDAFDVRVELLARANGLAPDTRFQLATIALDDATLIEVDAFPPGAIASPASACGLPSGIAMMTFHAFSPGGAAAPATAVLQGAAGELTELLITTI